jgi:DNA polymerase III subunit beta
MKFNINSRALEKVLAKVLPVIPAKTPAQQIENFLFQINENLLTVTATDLELFLQSSITVDATEDFEGLIPAKLFFDIVRSLPDAQLSFETTAGSKLKLKTSSGTYHVGYTENVDFPAVPSINYTKQFNLSGKSLKRALEQSTFAIGKEPLKAAMTGLLFDFTDEGLKFVATDGHKLVRFINKTIRFSEPEQIIVPEKAISILSKLLTDDNVDVHYTSTNVHFKLDDISMISVLIAQKYPAYNSVIPLENENILKIDVDPLLTAVKRMQVFANSNFQQVKLSISEKAVELSTEDIDHGSSGSETVEGEYIGSPMNIGFNTSFLYEVLSHLKNEKIAFRFDTPTRAAIVENTAAKEDEDLLMLLMPVRLNS